MNQVLKSFMDNLFSPLPTTDEMNRLKESLSIHMEEKYQEYKESGKSENEAIGLVIAEFGNMDEILAEYDINLADQSEGQLTLDEAQEIVGLYRRFSKIIACSVSALIILVGIFVASFILFSEVDNIGVYAPIGLLVGVSPFVGILVFSGIKLSPYGVRLQNPFVTSMHTKQIIKQEKKDFEAKFAIHITVAVILCVLGVSLIILGSTLDGIFAYAFIAAFVIIAFAVYLFITSGNLYGIYHGLLKDVKEIKAAKKSEKLIEAIAPVYWCLIVATYLAISFIGGRWDISWVIFPIAGVAFGAIVTLIEAISKKDE